MKTNYFILALKISKKIARDIFVFVKSVSRFEVI